MKETLQLTALQEQLAMSLFYIGYVSFDQLADYCRHRYFLGLSRNPKFSLVTMPGHITLPFCKYGCLGFDHDRYEFSPDCNTTPDSAISIGKTSIATRV